MRNSLVVKKKQRFIHHVYTGKPIGKQKSKILKRVLKCVSRIARGAIKCMNASMRVALTDSF